MSTSPSLDEAVIATPPLPDHEAEGGLRAAGAEGQDDWWGGAVKWWSGLIGAAHGAAAGGDPEARAAEQDLNQAQSDCQQRDRYKDEIAAADKSLDARIKSIHDDWRTTYDKLLWLQKGGKANQDDIEKAYNDYQFLLDTYGRTRQAVYDYYGGLEQRDRAECVTQMKAVTGHKTWASLRPAAHVAAGRVRQIPRAYYQNGVVRRRQTLQPPITALVARHNQLLQWEGKLSGKVHSLASTSMDSWLGKLPPPPP
jgi:hypothetical protein